MSERPVGRPLNLPVGIASLALGFWGWQAGVLPLAGPLAFLLIASCWWRHRTPLTDAEFHRVLDVCWVLGFGGLLLVYSREAVGNILSSFVRWLPVVVFPAVLAQVWSTRGRVPANSLLPLPGWRRRSGEANPPLEVTPVFVLVCLLAASTAGGGRSWTFYAGLAGVLGAAIVGRPSVTPIPRGRAVGLFAVAATGGWLLAGGLANLQPWIESRVMEWTARLQQAGAPGREARTAIGRRGRVGGSDRVVLRLRSDGTGLVPWRLQVAGFSLWQDGSWYAHRGDVRKIEGTADAWRLDPRPADGGGVVVEWVPALTEGLVPLPLATRIIRDLPADEVDRTWLGTVRAEVRAGLVEYRAEFGAEGTWEGPPVDEDQRGISPLEAPAIEAVARELKLAGQPPREVMQRIEGHFRRHFRYTLELVQGGATDPRATTALGRFLLGHRAGHCEYFATAAVLLLRAAGVPARYATGYAIRAEERDGDVYTVRASQAHAWVRVWDHGNWVDFDPTPSLDFGVDGAVPEWRRRLSRGWHEFWYAISRWWWLGEKRLLRQAYWLSVPLLATLLWRFRRLRVAADPHRSPSGAGGTAPWPGLDSEWFAVDAELTRRGVARRPQEPMAVWMSRLASVGWDPGELGLLCRTAVLHQRLRFDPAGLRDDERGRLRQSAGTLYEGLVTRSASGAGPSINRGDAATKA